MCGSCFIFFLHFCLCATGDENDDVWYVALVSMCFLSNHIFILNLYTFIFRRTVIRRNYLCYHLPLLLLRRICFFCGCIVFVADCNQEINTKNKELGTFQKLHRINRRKKINEISAFIIIIYVSLLARKNLCVCVCT